MNGISYDQTRHVEVSAPSAADQSPPEVHKENSSGESVLAIAGDDATADSGPTVKGDAESRLPTRPAPVNTLPPDGPRIDPVTVELDPNVVHDESNGAMENSVNRAAQSTGDSLASVKVLGEQNLSVPSQPSEQPSNSGTDQVQTATIAPSASQSDLDQNQNHLEPHTESFAVSTESSAQQALPNPDLHDQSATGPNIATSKVREREPDDSDEGPSAKRPRTNDDVSADDDMPMSDAPAQITPQQVPSSAAVPPEPSLDHVQEYGTMTETQRKRLLEGLKNIKKGKFSKAYLKPVDPVIQNLPTYFDVIKYPMDLGTIEQKLKDDHYRSVADYITDFDLMVNNSVTFNTQNHPIAQAGLNIRSQLNSQLKKVPKAGEGGDEAPANLKKHRKSSGSEPHRESKRRESRLSLATAPAAADQTPHAPGPDGVPLIRRDSTLGDRPKRKIQKPPPRDLSYPKPAKKKYQAELRFCSHVLEEMQRPRYQVFSTPFLTPVDPVALGIPDYFKVIKKPMDVSTVAEKLNSGQYENAKEFEADFRQIFANCYKFNPTGNAVRMMGQQYEELFNDQWSRKQSWITDHAPTPNPQSPEMESEEEIEEDENDEEDDKDAKIAALHQQLIALQEQTSSLMGKSAAKGNAKKGPKSTAAKSSTKQKKLSHGGPGSASKPEKKPKPKQPKATKPQRPTSQKEKQEIANRIAELSPDDIEKAATIIRTSLRKAGKHDLAVSTSQSF